MPRSRVSSRIGAAAIPAPALTLISMLSFQLAAAWSLPLVPVLSAVGVTWIRLACAAVIMLALVRPAGLFSFEDCRAPILLGLATAGMSIAYLEAVSRIPLGMATTIEFMGPLGLALMSRQRGQDILWAAMAAAGVLLLVGHELRQPSWGEALGMAFAAMSGLFWVAYTLLTVRLGRSAQSLSGLTVAFAVAALVSAPFGLPQVAGTVTLLQLAAIAGIAVLAPLLPFCLELAALRRMSTGTFGILMSLDPAISALTGLVVVGQELGWLTLAGIGCVSAASMGTSWTAGRLARHASSPADALPQALASTERSRLSDETTVTKQR